MAPFSTIYSLFRIKVAGSSARDHLVGNAAPRAWAWCPRTVRSENLPRSCEVWKLIIKDTHTHTHQVFSVVGKNRVTIHTTFYRGWVIDAQRCCRDRLAGARKTLRQNDWLHLFEVCVWLACDGWLHLQNRSALTVVMTPNISSVISERRSDNL